MSGKYVRVDDVMELINTSNRGTCDYFIVDQIEELCRSEKIYDLDKAVEQLKYQKSIWNHDEVADQKMVEAKRKAYDMAIKIVQGGGVNG